MSQFYFINRVSHARIREKLEQDNWNDSDISDFDSQYSEFSSSVQLGQSLETFRNTIDFTDDERVKPVIFKPKRHLPKIN